MSKAEDEAKRWRSVPPFEGGHDHCEDDLNDAANIVDMLLSEVKRLQNMPMDVEPVTKLLRRCKAAEAKVAELLGILTDALPFVGFGAVMASIPENTVAGFAVAEKIAVAIGVEPGP